MYRIKDDRWHPSPGPCYTVESDDEYIISYLTAEWGMVEDYSSIDWDHDVALLYKNRITVGL